MSIFLNFFQTAPPDQLTGTYNTQLVILSYIVATGASYVALDITNRMRDVYMSRLSSFLWLLGGSFAMGAGIWSMHFIGMLAFIMPMPMAYDPLLTAFSMIIAIIASGIAFSLLSSKTIKFPFLILGGVFLGFSIAAMHYVGMAAMEISMNIYYLPGLFLLSILIAVVASEVALYLALLSSSKREIKARELLKVGSALIMGAAICGMHYTGMAAAIFTPLHHAVHDGSGVVDPYILATTIAVVTIFIMGIAVSISSFQARLNANALHIARQAGMAEVASSVLHNVGNVLNSVNISASMIESALKNIDLNNLERLNRLLDDNKEDLGRYISEDPKGKIIPEFLSNLTKYWQDQYHSLQNEISSLVKNVQHIKDVIAMQQTLCGEKSFEELASIDEVIEEALTVVAINFERHKIRIKREYAKLEPAYIDRLKVVQILINLIRNSSEALSDVQKQKNKFILFKIGLSNADKFFIQIIDNGVGITAHQMPKIFSHGYTTKSKGHGFGLHASAIAADDMLGDLSVKSDGVGKGAIFTLILPYKVNQPAKIHQEV